MDSLIQKIQHDLEIECETVECKEEEICELKTLHKEKDADLHTFCLKITALESHVGVMTRENEKLLNQISRLTGFIA